MSAEDKLQKTEKKLAEISMTLKRLDLEYQKVLSDIDMTPEQLNAYVANPDNFDPPIWEHLQNEKKQHDEKLNLELSCITNPSKTKKALNERGAVQPHWLFVR